ncbi:hypothetical protein [Parvibaculum sp.]|uniref:hypothetical protein n=1 Tax=Parvibaculum sp. TaxID=2024848 RepID=UPI003C747923
MTGPEKETDEARQGETGLGVRYVLSAGLAGVVILFAIIYLSFFGFPHFGLNKAQTGGDGTASPTEQYEEEPEWQEPAPVRPSDETPR